MKVGDYVRTKDGIILKIKDIEDIYTTDNIYIGMSIYDNEGHFVNDVEIIKSSPNIIDLIEVRDYVNDYYVEDIRLGYEGDLIIECATGSNYFQAPMHEEDIKSIVTKEQFKSMKYEVGK